MIIIKLGGSLTRRSGALVNCLNAVERNYQDKAVIIVPGGGAFAAGGAAVGHLAQALQQFRGRAAVVHLGVVDGLDERAELCRCGFAHGGFHANLDAHVCGHLQQ